MRVVGTQIKGKDEVFSECDHDFIKKLQRVYLDIEEELIRENERAIAIGEKMKVLADEHPGYDCVIQSHSLNRTVLRNQSHERRISKNRRDFAFRIQKYFKATHGVTIDAEPISSVVLKNGLAGFEIESVQKQLNGESLESFCYKQNVEYVKKYFKGRLLVAKGCRLEILNSGVCLQEYGPCMWTLSDPGSQKRLNTAINFFEYQDTYSSCEGVFERRESLRLKEVALSGAGFFKEVRFDHCEKIKGIKYYRSGRFDIRFADETTLKGFLDLYDLKVR